MYTGSMLEIDDRTMSTRIVDKQFELFIQSSDAYRLCRSIKFIFGCCLPLFSDSASARIGALAVFLWGGDMRVSGSLHHLFLTLPHGHNDR